MGWLRTRLGDRLKRPKSDITLHHVTLGAEGVLDVSEALSNRMKLNCEDRLVARCGALARHAEIGSAEQQQGDTAELQHPQVPDEAERLHEVPEEDKAYDLLLTNRVLTYVKMQQFWGTVADVSFTAEGTKVYLIAYDGGDVEHLDEVGVRMAIANTIERQPAYQAVE